MIAASGPPARQPLLGDGNHLIESLLGPRCERIVTCSRRGKVFPLRRGFLRPGYEKKKKKGKKRLDDRGKGIRRFSVAPGITSGREPIPSSITCTRRGFSKSVVLRTLLIGVRRNWVRWFFEIRGDTEATASAPVHFGTFGKTV